MVNAEISRNQQNQLQDWVLDAGLLLEGVTILGLNSLHAMVLKSMRGNLSTSADGWYPVELHG